MIRSTTADIDTGPIVIAEMIASLDMLKPKRPTFDLPSHLHPNRHTQSVPPTW
jgi:hypothetical protein